MAQRSRPQSGHVNTYPNSDAGPYTGDHLGWGTNYTLENTGDWDTATERARLRGVIPSAWDKLVVTNPAGVTINVAHGAAWVKGHQFVLDPTIVPAATLNFTPSTPGIGDRIDRVVVVENNTNAAYTGLADYGVACIETPTDLTDYAATANTIQGYTARLAILTGIEGGAMRALTQSDDRWMIEIARYTITNVPAISVGPTDYREFAQIQNIVGVNVDQDQNMEDGLIIGVEVDDASVGTNGLGVAVLAKIQDAAGTLRNAGRAAWRASVAAAATWRTRWELRLQYQTSEVLCGVIEAPATASADGNARGVGAVDLQGYRAAVTEVAAGNYATISGGERNTVGADYGTVGGGQSNETTGDGATIAGGRSNNAGYRSAVGGGYSNDAAGNYATIGGGWNNNATGENATVAGGYSNSATGATNATVGGGRSNDATGERSTVGGGYDNDATGANATVAGGYGNDATGANACVPGGLSAVADKYGQVAAASGYFAAAGDAQGTIQMVARATATHGDATWRSLYLDGAGASERMTIAASTAWSFHVLIVGITQNAAAQWGYEIIGLIERDNANNTTLAGSTVRVIFESDANFAAQVVADDANEALVVQVSDAGSSGVTVRWVATVRLAEVSWP